MNSRNPFFFVAFIIYCFSFGCTSKTEEPPLEIAAILQSNEIQRTAHLQNDAALLVSQIADTMLSVQNGEWTINTNQAIQEQFENYFKRVKYTTWEDTQPPVIHVAKDGLSAAVYVQKLLDLQYRDEQGAWGPHNYALFAWHAQYEKFNQEWLINAITSTEKEMSAEEAMLQPVNSSVVYAEIPELDLIPEGVAYDNNTGITYLSSTYRQKILAINRDGTFINFKEDEEDGLWSTVGMEIDEANELLWVVSFSGNEVLPMKYPDPATDWQSRIYAYHLSDGRLMGVFDPEIEGKVAFNDLCVAKDGKVYVTESLGNRVFSLDPATGTFTTLPIQDSLFIFPNGITLSSDNVYLYIAVNSGIIQYDLQTKHFRFLKHSPGILTNRLDGLAYYKGTLIGNQSYRKRIVQWTIDESAGAIEYQRILEANHPDFDQPATGEIAGNSFIYLANAQMQSAFKDGKLRPENELATIKLLQVKLQQ